MTGIIRYRENEDTGAYEMYDARCADCIDFTPNWVESAGAGWVNGDREATEADEHIACYYCGNSVNAESELEEDYSDDSEAPLVEYAPGYTFVNVYEMDRAYGGPEEGGWYYDTGRLITSRQVPAESAESVSDTLREEYPRTGKRNSVIYSGYGDYDVVVEDHPGADFPEHTPHYE